MKGIVKTKKENGFGFITAEGMDKDLFFHRNGLVGVEFDALREGQEVTFEVADGTKGPQATNVEKA